YEEVFAEKLRALGERELPRDLYDVVHLYRHPGIRPDRAVVLAILDEKSQFKGIPTLTLETLKREPQRTELETEWSNMLAHQLPALPPFDQFWSELPQVFEWLAGTLAPATLHPIAVGADEDVQWTPPHMAQAWGIGVPLETIRFAAANRLCVNLGYKGTMRIIEPYSLRSTKDGNLILHAIRVDNREHRAYRVDEIQSAEVTQRGFSPVYAVELTPAGPIHAPLESMSGSTQPMRKVYTGRRRVSFAPTLKYIMECSACGKRFIRSKLDTKLNDHKDKNGHPCHGRYGHFVETKYS
ncbi:MAG: nucleotidyl transferase AbiEii/AbiGii toxin family protein, partial [Bacteroidota bacterium]